MTPLSVASINAWQTGFAVWRTRLPTSATVDAQEFSGPQDLGQFVVMAYRVSWSSGAF